MNPTRVLAAATAMEMCAVLAALGLAGLGGIRNGWLDVINSFAPIILLAAVVGAGLAYFQAVASLIAVDAGAVLLQEADGSLQADLLRLRAHYPFASMPRVRRADLHQSAHRRPRLRAHSVALSRPGLGSDPRSGRPADDAGHHSSWFQRAVVAGQIHGVATDAMILAGDFNTTPWSFAMRRQDQLFAPLGRRTHAWFSWPARLDALRQPWPLPILPIDHVYAGRDWETTRLTRLQIPG
jgi:endonuclease/exonuclease/phosphatase (EEP) superfamily protein YafD